MTDLKCSKCGYPMRNTKSRLKITVNGTTYRRWICFKCDCYNVQKEEEDNDDQH